jgi:hypothetical protein
VIWATLAATAALIASTVVFLAGLLLLALFVRNAAFALLALGELREKTNETDERRATVAAAREAVEDIRGRGVYGESADADLLRAVQAEAAMNGRPYRTFENEERNVEEPEEPDIPVDSFFVPSREQ